LILALVACPSVRAEAVATVSVDRLLALEDSVSEGQGRPVRCLLGYQSCLVYLSTLADKIIDTKGTTTVALVPPYRKAASAKDLSLLPGPSVFGLKDRAGGAEKKKPAVPDWAQPLPVDQAFYDRVWQDGELNITLSLGYRDLGGGSNPDLFNYGAYAVTLDRIRRFAREWSMTWRQVDPLESVAEVKIDEDRLLRLRVIDPHVFCPDEKAKVDRMEKGIVRDASGMLVKFTNNGLLSRKGNCPAQLDAAAEARRRFMAALAGSQAEDMVFYDGHSRYGRGPDFGPFSSRPGKILPADLNEAAISSKDVAAIYFNGCSGMKNYAALVKRASKAGKVVAWNTKAPSTTDSVDDLLLFTQGVIEQRPLAAVERYLNAVHADGRWPSEVRITR
jgi:hypothetical protein